MFEWLDLQHINGDPGDRMRFQVQVYETTNVIEFHYCSLNGPTDGGINLTTGGSATIGLETPSGAGGIQHSFKTTGAVQTASALRFTPQ